MTEELRELETKGKRQMGGLVDLETYEKYKASGMKISGIINLGLMYPNLNLENTMLKQTIENLQKVNKALEDTKRRLEDRLVELAAKTGEDPYGTAKE